MKTKTLVTNLSPKGFAKLSSELNNLKKDFVSLNDKFLDISLDYLMDRAIMHLSTTTGKGTYPLTGELASAFNKYREPNRAILRNEAFHAAITEFGSGIVGKTAPHEWAAELGIIYDANMHGEAGWTYQGNDGNYYHTTGMEAHRYMYNALMDYLYQGGKEACMKAAWEAV